MTYSVKGIFKTVQGEGYHAGRAAVFCRFAGCNLWSGREEDRAAAACRFCDTDFVGGDKYPLAPLLADAVEAAWGDGRRHRMVVFTGGEPLLQLTEGLLEAMRDRGFAAHVETNGTVAAPRGVRWLCLSPKAGTELRQTEADELKVAWPQDVDLEALRERVGAAHNFLQPIDGPRLAENTAAVVALVKARPWWRLSVQTHKIAGVP